MVLCQRVNCELVCAQAGGGARMSRHSVHFDLNDDIYVGGLPTHMYRLAAKSLLRARDGFHGCLASLRLNGPFRDLLDGSFQLPPHGVAFITPGCDGKNDYDSP